MTKTGLYLDNCRFNSPLKIVFLTVFFLSFQITAYSQYLEKKDIALFKASLPDLSGEASDIFKIREHYSSLNETIMSYDDATNDASLTLFEIEEKTRIFKQALENLLKTESLDLIDEPARWGRNAPQKFITIFWGSIYVYNQELVKEVNQVIKMGYWEEKGDLDNEERERLIHTIEIFKIFLRVNEKVFNNRDLKLLKADFELTERVYIFLYSLIGG